LLDDLARSRRVNANTLQRLRIEYEDRVRQLEVLAPGAEENYHGLFSSDYERLSFEALLVERKTILQLRNQEVINDEVLRRIQRDIDLAEARLHHPRRAAQ